MKILLVIGLLIIILLARYIFLLWRGSRRFKRMIEQWREGGYPNS